MKALFVTAHGDDLEVHAGGLVMKLLNAGHGVVSIVTTAGKRGQMYDTEPALVTRSRESTEAHQKLGLTPILLNRYEIEFGVTPETQKEMDDVFASIRPDIVITHWPIDKNWDHRVCGVLASAPCLEPDVNTELLFLEPNSSGRSSASFRPQSVAFFPTHYVDVTDEDVLAMKYLLCCCHQSQDPDGMWQGQFNSQENRGREAGVKQAEAYVRATRYGELHADLQGILIPTQFKLPRPIGVDFDPQIL